MDNFVSLWINFFLNDVDGVTQLTIALDIHGYFFRTMNDGGVIPSTKRFSNLDEWRIRQDATQIHGNLAWIGDFLRPLLTN